VSFPKWTEIDAADTLDAATGNMLLLDTETGKMYSGIEGRLPTRIPGAIYIWWGDHGGVELRIYGSSNDPLFQQAHFVGEVQGEMAWIPGEAARVSSKGIAAMHRGADILLYDLATRQEVGSIANPPTGYTGSWSADGRYLTFHAGNSLTREATRTSIWDSESGKVVAEVPAAQISWSNHGSKLLYGVVARDDPDQRVIESRVLDVSTGIDQWISSELVSYWSPDDRFAVSAPFWADHTRHDFTVYDVAAKQALITLTGSWFMGWIGADTISLMGSVCGNSAFYTLDASGSDLREISQFDRPIVAYPSPNGDRIAFTSRNEFPDGKLTPIRAVTLLDTTSGVVREYDTGSALLPAGRDLGIRWWSPDGRYLLLVVPAGKDGPCFEQEPQIFQLIRHP
jgi:hypothetical protein